MRKLNLLFGLLAVSLCLNAQGVYEKHVFTSSIGESLNYRLLRPEEKNTNEKYPLVLFMHGAGERGSDNEKQLIHGGQMFLNPVNREKYPAYVLFPQCPEAGYWAYNERPVSFIPDEMPASPELTTFIQSVKELVDTYISQPDVDKSRVYIIGISMGGMATYDLTIRFPETFAAAVPICGTVNPNRLSAAKGLKFRIFHGDNDDVVPVEGSRAAYRALRAAGADVEYFELPGVNHGSWNPAFNFPDFMEWLFGQKK